MMVDWSSGLYQLYLSPNMSLAEDPILYIPYDHSLELFFIRYFCLFGFDYRVRRDSNMQSRLAYLAEPVNKSSRKRCAIAVTRFMQGGSMPP